VTHLHMIAAQRRKDIATEKRFVTLQTFAAMVARREDTRDLCAAVRAVRPAIIAEIKRASPSAGRFVSAGVSAGSIAAQYELGGASAISVLTESRQFHGSFADLRDARAASSLPILCKDLVVDELQIWKAAAFGADAVLLIIALLTRARLRAFLKLSTQLHLNALVEVHNEDEARIAVAAGAAMIGINNRNLHNFTVNRANAIRVRRCIPTGIVVVAESGYQSAGEVEAAAAGGIDAVLVGEALMRSADRVGAVRDLCAVQA
jgi:indole-3-glycerol phosphate synthase